MCPSNLVAVNECFSMNIFITLYMCTKYEDLELAWVSYVLKQNETKNK